MQETRIAAVSMNCGLGQPQQSLDAIATWCPKAKDAGADLVLFPELIVHGHCSPNTWHVAEPVPAGPSVRRLEELAREHGLVLSVGLSEKENDIVYNAQVLVGPDGYIGKQRKIHPSRDEVLYYKGDSQVHVFDAGKCRVGSVICYDNLHPEVPRLVALGGADVILAPHAGRLKVWQDTAESQRQSRRHSCDFFRELKLRARENACFLVIADQAGRSGHVDMYPPDHRNQPNHAGGAFIFGPSAQTLAESQDELIRDEMVVATLDPFMLAEARSHPNYTLRTRRPECFGKLVGPSGVRS